MTAREDAIKEFSEDLLTLFNEHFTPEGVDDKEEYLYKKYDWERGASKFALFCREGVIKIPFDGWLSNKEFYQFKGARCDKDPSDYCLYEIYLYHLAKQRKLNSIFLKTQYITTQNNRRFYFQQYAEPLSITEEDDDSYNINSYNKAKELGCNYYFGCVEKWLADAIDYYGEAFMSKLIEFIDELGISDLHGDNVGYLKGKPVIIDYADYDS